MEDLILKTFGLPALAVAICIFMIRWFMARVESQDKAREDQQKDIVRILTTVISDNTVAFREQTAALREQTAALKEQTAQLHELMERMQQK